MTNLRRTGPQARNVVMGAQGLVNMTAGTDPIEALLDDVSPTGTTDEESELVAYGQLVALLAVIAALAMYLLIVLPA